MTKASAITEKQQQNIDFVIKTYNSSLKILTSTLESGITDDRVSIDMFMILEYIDRAGNNRITLSDIAEKQEVTKSAISRKVGTLLEMGYIDQLTDRVDRRKKYLVMTPEGEKLFRENEQVFLEMLTAISEKYGMDDFIVTLTHINEVLDIIKKFMNV